LVHFDHFEANENGMLMQAAEQDYEKEKLNERIAKLSGGVAVIQVNYQLLVVKVICNCK
jgi:chaperonin GroEL (HSP60 family)